ncbi:MAG: phage holin family protein [Firmicutes bacterium]|nr:phage holin family protein [Bacillota bacterium]
MLAPTLVGGRFCCIPRRSGGRIHTERRGPIANSRLRGGESSLDWLGTLVRFVVSAIVLMVVAFIVPGFAPLGFWSALLAAAVIAAVGWLIEATLGKGVSPFGRGIVGFIVSALVIWATQFVVPDMSVSLIGALLAAFVIGIIDLFVPTTVR